MNTNKLSLRRNVIYLAVVQGSNYLLPLLTFPYLVRTLGPENFGIFGFCQATMLYMIMFVEYGFNLTATQSIAKAADSKDKVTSIFWAVIFSKIVLIVITLIFLTSMTLLVPEYNKHAVIIWSFVPALVGNLIYPIWLFQGKKNEMADFK